MGKTIESYIGKVRLVGKETVRVSLWDEQKNEIIGDLKRSYFHPNVAKGYCFQYKCSLTITDAPKMSHKQVKEYNRKIKIVIDDLFPK